MVIRTLAVTVLIGAHARAAVTNVNIQGAPTATQAVLSYTAPNNSACTIMVSESATFSPLVPDVDATLFANANIDLQRDGTIVLGQVRTVVLGKRAAELALDGRRHSRALQAYTTHYYQISCGSSVASGTFMTQNPPLGNTYNDPVFDRNRPGEYAYPTINWADKMVTYIDPHTGVLLKRMSGPGELVPSSVTGLLFSNAAALGAGWSISGLQANYTGSSQAPVYYRSADPTWPGGASGKSPDYVQINLAGASGSAVAAADRTINLCLTNNGVNCAGKVIQLTLTNSAANYTLGDTTPILEFWRGTPELPSQRDDMRVLNGTVQVAGNGVTVTWQGGDTFSLNWTAGSHITLDGVDCALQSITNENIVTLASSTCVSGGAHAYAARNWGVLISKATASADAISVNGAMWNLGTSGYAFATASGGYDLCSPTVVPGPTGPGSHCATGGSVFAQYASGNALFWIGDDGTANPIGMGSGTSDNLAGRGICTSTTAWNWDRVTPGLYWCVGTAIPSGSTVIFKVQYTGSNTPVPIAIDSQLTPATTTIVSGDISTLVASFNPEFSSFSCGSGWLLVGRSRDNLVLNCNQFGQNSPTWMAIYSTVTNSIIAATSSYGGSAGAANRWSDNHSLFTAGDNDWILLSAGSVGDLAYQTPITAGTLTSSFSNCPSNSIDGSATGTARCSVVTVSTLTPADPGTGQTLFGQQLLAGDFMQVVRQSGAAWLNDSETVRILAISGRTLTLQRALRTYDYSLNSSHSSAVALQVAPGALHELWWDYVDDPLGRRLTKPYGLTLLEDPQTEDCHQVYNLGIFLSGCLKSVPVGKIGTSIRLGALPVSTSTTNPFLNPIYFINFDAGFAGNNYEIPSNALESHPSMGEFSASVYEQTASYDGRPYMGDFTIATPALTTKLAGTTFLYKVAASATASLTPRLQPLLMTSGAHPVVDVSPAVILDTAADHFKGCYVVKANDCMAGSVPGEVYFNVPFAAAPYCFLSRFSPTAALSDVCVTANTSAAQRIIESANLYDDNNGALVRKLTNAFSPYKTESVFWNVRATPNAKWVYWVTTNAGGARNELMMLKTPPLPGLESVNRGTFVPVPVTAGAAAGKTAARVRFGYAENGPTSSFYCTQRQVDCITSAPAGTPFVWNDEPQTPQACAAGCTISIPAIPGRVLYYVIERQSSSGSWIAGAMQAVAVK